MPRAKTATPIPTASADVAAAAAELLRLQEAAKAAYRQIDDLEATILTALDATKRVNKLLLPDGRIVSRKDNFAGRNVAFKTAAMRRFEIVVA